MKAQFHLFGFLIFSFFLSSCIDIDKYIKYVDEEPPKPPVVEQPENPGEQVDPTEPGGSVDVSPPPEPGTTEPGIPESLQLTSVYPNRGGVAGGYEVRVRGKGLSKDTEVLFGNVPVLSKIFVSNQTLRVVLAPSKFGCVEVSLRKGQERVDLKDGFCYTQAVNIKSFEPQRAKRHVETPFILLGTGLNGPLSISIGGALAREITVESPNRVTGILPSLPVGTHAVRVVNAYGQDLAQSALQILAKPQISGFSPQVLSTQTQGTVKIVGSDLDQGEVTVFIGGQKAEITAKAQGALELRAPILGAGSYDVVVIVDLVQKRFERALHYVDVDSGAPVMSLQPTTGPVEGGNEVVLEGYNLPSQGSVFFGDVLAQIIERSPKQIRVIVPPAQNSGSVSVRLGSLSALEQYRYETQPQIKAISPSSGPMQGESAVSLNGTGFSGAMQVYFGASQATDLVVQSPNAATLRSPAGSGLAPILVKQNDSLLDSGQAFLYLSPLDVFGLQPDNSPSTGGAKIQITGQGFSPDCTATLSDAALELNYVDTNLLEFVSPPHAVGLAPLVLKCAESQIAQSLDYFNPTGMLTSASGGALSGNLNVHVRTVDTGTAIGNAHVQVGLGSTALKGESNAEGLISFFDPSLYGPQTVLACAEGYSCTSLQSVDAKIVTLYLEKDPSPTDSTEPPPPPPPPPDPNDINPIEITVPYTPKPSYFQGTATGFDKVALESDPNKVKAAVVLQSQIGTYTGAGDQNDINLILNDKGTYKIRARAGDVALALLCGLYDKQTGAFDARFIGVKRHLFVSDGQNITANLDCTLPLNQSLSVKLLDAPLQSGPNSVQASAYLFIGNEGYIGGFMKGSSQNDLVVINKMPPLRGDLEGCYFSVITGAYTNNTSPSAVVYDYEVYPSNEILPQGPVMGIPLFENASPESILKQGSLSWKIENPQNVDYYSISIRLYTNKMSKLLWQFYLPGSASSIEFPAQNIDLSDESITYASIYLGIMAYKSARQGYDFNLFSTMDLRYNYVLSSSSNYLNIALK